MTTASEFLIIGHRGAAGLAPENTLPSFRKALELGVDAIELDVYSIEGELLVFHDDTLDRTTNGTGEIQAQSLTSLRELDAGQGARIPLLEEVLDLVDGQVLVNIELKGPDTAEPVAARLGDWPSTRFLVSSFYHGELTRFHQLAPAVPTAPLFSKTHARMFDIAESLNAWSINLSRRITSSNLLAEIRRRGYRSLIYTVNDPEMARHLAADGASGIFTDYPDRCGRAALGL